jgi:hypothetical protein
MAAASSHIISQLSSLLADTQNHFVESSARYIAHPAARNVAAIKVFVAFV